MSIWDHMHKAEKPPTPQAIDRAPDGFAIRWDDGVTTRVSVRKLRLGCPCAMCVDEATGRPLLDPQSVAEGIGVTRMEQVGNYAVRIVFTDGHETGLFDWALMRRLSS
jgi:DUF971 family protein